MPYRIYFTLFLKIYLFDHNGQLAYEVNNNDNIPMDEKAIFNATVCILGIAIFLIHSIDLALKKGKRSDEKNLLVFFVFTVLHFATYLTFTLLKPRFGSNPFTMGFYTAFYVMNNMEILLLFAYAISFLQPKKIVVRVSSIINFAFFAAIIVLDFANIFGHFFFYADNGNYQRASLMLLSEGYQFIGLAIVFFLAVTDKKASISEKMAFVIYCLIPFVAIIVQNALSGYAIAYLSIVISIEVLFLFANVKKNALIAEQQRINKEAEIRLMMSQIRPHFVYNALSSISTLITINPEEAQTALDNFTEYLRANLNALSDTHLIPFSDELRHIETYLALEKIRFGNRLTVLYDIEERDFLVPPLSIQPLVENAVKHGIMKRVEGGIINFSTYEDNGQYIVKIVDNGLGFDEEAIKKEKGHVGLKNVAYRISSMCEGTMAVHSTPGKGTEVTLTFKKEDKE